MNTLKTTAWTRLGKKEKAKVKDALIAEGHISRENECASKGKGKSKTVECYTRGGNHMARHCDAGWYNGKG